ncbi:MAG: TIGR03905 family TSCPD domain-containing protein [Eubacteriaceae bacterium]
MKKMNFVPKGVCVKELSFDLDHNQVRNINFIGGCPGNLKALSKVLEGKTVDEISGLFKGQTCGNKESSCMDQLVIALEEGIRETK